VLDTGYFAKKGGTHAIASPNMLSIEGMGYDLKPVLLFKDATVIKPYIWEKFG